MGTYFSDRFEVDPSVLGKRGALDISLVTDLPLFIDPFLLFNSKKAEYRKLHDQVIEYLVFLRDKAQEGSVSEPMLRSWYCFPEVKQTWLGFSEAGNECRGLGIDFARRWATAARCVESTASPRAAPSTCDQRFHQL